MKSTTRALFFTLTLTIFAFFSLLYVSCTNKDKTSPFMDKCAAISCAYGGRCDDGKCICPTGYEGDNCEIVSRAKFLHSWNVHETGTITANREYAIAIEAGDAPNRVIIKNMYNYFATNVSATIIKDTIFVPNQQLNGKIVFGKGYIYADTLDAPYSRITMRYEVVDSANNLIVDDFGYYSNLDNSNPSAWH